MKSFLVPLLASLLALASGVDVRSNDRTITQVVKLLQGMLDRSKQEGKDERELYAKYKCYCDTNEEEKTTSIEDLTKQIGLLENEIESLKGANGALAMESAKLKQDMDTNKEDQKAAVALRDKAGLDFEATEKDLKAAITQMGLAIDTLSAIGSDQSLQASAAHDKFMANYKSSSLVKLQATVQKAQNLAEAFLTPMQRKKFDSFLQAPFTATYTAQSGGIVGILKSMKETFESNLQSAIDAEDAQVEAHKNYIDTMESSYTTMETAFNDKQGILADNDGTLATKKEALGAAEQQLGDDQEFLGQLTQMCKEKAEDFEKRKMFRSNEEAAISKAIAILNSDKAFASFGKVAATSTGSTGASFVQIRSHRQRDVDSQQRVRMDLETYLRHEAAAKKSTKVGRIASMVKMNPFTVILNEIDKMKALIEEEAKADQEQLDWCNDERKANNDNLELKKGAITTLETRIGELETSIDDPQAGLKVSIENKEQAIEDNYKQQEDETAVRRTENQVYQETIANTQEASTLLEEAIAVLEKYYSTLAESVGAFVQKKQPTPPDTWEGDYAGQKEDGNSAVGMLKFILSETEKEEETAHTTESEAQAAYEDSMGTLKKDETDLQDGLVTLKKELADAEEELLTKRQDLASTEKDKAAIEKYLEKIKPGCDFIVDNFADREAFRSEETTALNTAVEKIKGTPAFAAAAAKDKEKGWGVCSKTCSADEAHADCQSCLAGVTKSGYCAGHKGTPGC